MTYREVLATALGGPEVLEVRSGPAPEPGPGEVLVEVRAIGVNAWDVKSYSPSIGSDVPVRLGAECAGVVVGTGEEVVVHPVPGAYADRVVAKAENVLPKPADLTWEQAAGLLLTGTAAAHLVEAGGVGDGETVLLHGAAGGVGLFAAQLAARRGARVLGTALPQDHDLLRELGVEPFDFRADVHAWATGQGVDVVLDAVGTPAVLDLSLSLTDRVTTLVPSDAARERGVTQLGFGEGADPGTDLRRAARADLLDAAGAGWLRVVVAETFPLDRAADAHRALVGPHAAGKIVLVP